MSLTYTEIYQNKIRNKNKLSNSKIISLIKKFPLNKRKTFETNKNFKPRRIQSQSKTVQTIQKYRKTNSQKKEMPKYNLDNLDNIGKNKNLNKTENIKRKNERKKNNIIDNNEIENNNFYNTEINTFMNSPKNNNKKNKTCVKQSQSSKKNINKKNTKENMDKNEQKQNKENSNIAQDNLNSNFIELNKYCKPNKFDEINKTNKSSLTSLDTYFDIFKLRQHAANFKEKLKYNNINSNINSENAQVFNITRNNSEEKNKQKRIKSYSDFIQKKSKTYYKAIKLKEELEKKIFENNYINNHMYSSCINFYTRNNKNKNQIKEINNIFSDTDEKRPKVMKKFLTQNGTFNSDKNNIKTRIFNSGFNYCNENCKNDDKFREDIYQTKYKRKVNFNNKSLNLIIEENHKLNNLLRKIPSNKDKREKSLELINYIYQIKKKDNNNYMTNYKYNSNIKSDIYPVNEWEPIAKLKYKTFA